MSRENILRSRLEVLIIVWVRLKTISIYLDRDQVKQHQRLFPYLESFYTCYVCLTKLPFNVLMGKHTKSRGEAKTYSHSCMSIYTAYRCQVKEKKKPKEEMMSRSEVVYFLPAHLGHISTEGNTVSSWDITVHSFTSHQDRHADHTLHSQ